jgi:hypothetical protein
MKKLLSLGFVAAWLALPALLRAASNGFPYTIDIDIVQAGFDETQQPRVRLKILDAQTNQVEVLLTEKGFPFDSDTYDFRTDNGRIIKLRPRSVSKNLVSQLTLIPVTPLLSGSGYTLDVPAGKLYFLVNGVEIPGPAFHAVIPADLAMISFKYAQPDLVEKKISLMGGNVGGVAALHLAARQTHFLEVPWLNVDLVGDAQITLDPKQSTNFFNHIEGEVRAWYPVNQWGRHGEFFLHSKLESDERFENIDSLFGGGLAFFTKDPVSKYLSRLFTKDTIVTPLIIVGYDYVHELKDDAAKNIDSGENSSRLTALLRWQLPVARSLTLGSFGETEYVFDIDVDFELKGIYDTRAGKFLDQSWITLELTPKNKAKEGQKPGGEGAAKAVRTSITFTWARGKAGPNFDQINALLAGLKVQF